MIKIKELYLRDIVCESILNLGLDVFSLPKELVKAFVVLKRSEFITCVKNSGYYKSSKNIDIALDKLNALNEEQQNILYSAYDETDGVIVLNSGEPVELYFTKCCGGGTSNSENILGYKVNYLRKVLCKKCSERCEEVKVDCNTLAELLNCKVKYKEQIREIIKDVSRDDTGRIRKLNILGKDITGEKIMELLKLPSNRIYFKEDSIVLKVIGEGLGLGICVEGAVNLANENKDFKDIIEYYYTGVEFVKIDEQKIVNSLEGRKIVIDAGHGGKDFGNINGDVKEKDINLFIALKLNELLNNKGADCTLTRYKDEDIPLSDRVKIINRKRPDIFISIHQNSFPQESVNGIEVYCFKDDSDAIELSSMILDSVSKNVELKNRGVRNGEYYLLRESKSTGVIVECMYITGNYDSQKLEEESLEKIAEAIYEAVCEYFNVNK